MFGLNERTLSAIETCLQQYPDIAWVKIYGSRAKGTFQRGSDIDLAFSCPVNCAAKLLDDLDNLPTPYLFDVTHYESLKNEALKSHIDRVGVPIYPVHGEPHAMHLGLRPKTCGDHTTRSANPASLTLP